MGRRGENLGGGKRGSELGLRLACNLGAHSISCPGTLATSGMGGSWEDRGIGRRGGWRGVRHGRGASSWSRDWDCGRVRHHLPDSYTRVAALLQQLGPHPGPPLSVILDLLGQRLLYVLEDRHMLPHDGLLDLLTLAASLGSVGWLGCCRLLHSHGWSGWRK